MSTILAPQFETHSLDLILKKGESAQFSVAVTDFDLDLRGCLIFTEIRRLSPGYNLIPTFTGAVSNSSSTIQLIRYPAMSDKAQLLSSLPVRLGDLITLEGSGITGSKVLAVTDSQITVSGVSNRSVSEARLFVRSLSLASFTAVPYLPNITITLTSLASIGATTLNVSNITRVIPAGTTLIFNDNGVADPVTLTSDLTPGSIVANVSPLSVAISANATATIGAATVISTATSAVGSTSLIVSAVSVPMPSGTILNFATRTSDGWQYVGAATLTAAALQFHTTLTVATLPVAIPPGAIAWFGTHPFNSFYLAIDPADTQFLESGNYGYDVICRQSNGYTIRLIQGNCTLTDHWSDGL
ncbi:MAG: hypothetical protein ACKPBB_09515 [Sphaerospermopsis kisseleviana]